VRAAWWQERQDEIMDGFMVEPQNQGRAGTTWEPSHEWRLAEATLIRGVSSGSPENQWVPWLVPKAKTEELKMEVQQHRTGLTGERRRNPETLKSRTRVGIARLASRLSNFAFAGHPSHCVMKTIPLGGRVS
jgi:hypothetical protein